MKSFILGLVLLFSVSSKADPCSYIEIGGTWNVSSVDQAGEGTLVISSRAVRASDKLGNSRLFRPLKTKIGNYYFYQDFDGFNLAGKVSVKKEQLCFIEFYNYKSKNVMMLQVDRASGYQVLSGVYQKARMELSEYRNPNRKFIFELEKR